MGFGVTKTWKELPQQGEECSGQHIGNLGQGTRYDPPYFSRRKAGQATLLPRL